MRILHFCLGLALLGSGARATIEHPLSVSPDGSELLDAAGETIFVHAASAWNLATRLTIEEAEEFLLAIRARGYNSFLMTAMVSAGYPAGTVENVYGEAPLLDIGDFTTTNEAYFQHLDALIDLAESLELTVFLFPAYLGYNCGPEGWCQQMLWSGTQKLRSYGRWLGERYLDRPHLIWVHGGDADAAAYGAMDAVVAVAEGILEVDSVHLHTSHCTRFASGFSCYDFPWLDLETVYSACDESPLAIREAAQANPTRPAVYVEGRYEFEFDWTPVCIRSQAYWSLLAGLNGQFFGSGKIWDFPADWRDGLDSEGDQAMRWMRRLHDHRAEVALQPDLNQSILLSGSGSISNADFAAAARRPDGASIVVYLPSPRPITIAMDQLSGSTAEARWFDPASGAVIFAGSFPTTGTQSFATPLPLDSVLLLDDADAGLVPFWELATPAPTTLSLAISAVYPNPFNPRLNVEFRAAAGQAVTLELFDLRGRLQAIVHRGIGSGAVESLSFDAGHLGSGVYLLRASAGGESVEQKALLLK